MTTATLDHLDLLEQQSVYIFREAFRHFDRMCMLWSIGKDSTVLLCIFVVVRPNVDPSGAARDARAKRDASRRPPAAQC